MYQEYTRTRDTSKTMVCIVDCFIAAQCKKLNVNHAPSHSLSSQEVAVAYLVE